MSQLQGVPPRPPRLFPAAQILSGEIRLDGYPFRHIAVHGGGHVSTAAIDLVLSAVEMLDPVGWDLVNITDHDTLHYVAFLRVRT
ncbi:hypothetical protein EV652_101495 [Kribbella steppae]|uniref:Uncharacterized protein n=1 Tax=Kribbella steppae TaxID=2512223 RepID=A0A4R2HVS6_9ACTN|nr:hypothetical protein [Kribbella steppae]TCO35611.1 hypothetical protein EV652_101495 [Kribbella steppae]